MRQVRPLQTTYINLAHIVQSVIFLYKNLSKSLATGRHHKGTTLMLTVEPDWEFPTS